MSASKDFNRLYTDVANNIATAMAEIEDLKVERKDGKQELSKMMERLREIQSRFSDELVILEENAEWDKFTMAFFGETNAGKSTIIESLRILFNEDSRQQALQRNAHDLVKFETELVSHVQQVRESLNNVYGVYASEIAAINHSAKELSRIVSEESSARIKFKLWLYAGSGALIGGIVVGTIKMLVGG